MAAPTLLIVDDEPANLAVLRNILDDSYRLVFATNGADTLAAAAKHAPALVLLDVQMPDMNGYDVCRRLKADPRTRDVPVIFVTTRSDVGDEADGFEAGAVDYLVKPVTPAIVRARVRTHLSLINVAVLERSYRDAILMLGQIGHFNDSDTGAHIWRMAAYVRALAAEVGWDADRATMLELAAPLHDTGKVAIPHEILRKPGPLNAAEWAVMKTHSRVGHTILSRSTAPIFQMAAEIALRHHERWDGSGYPDGLSGAAIPESARIVAVADVFDALSVKRPYKTPWPPDRIVEHIRDGAGNHFDPDLVRLFIDALPAMYAIKASWDDRETG